MGRRLAEALLHLQNYMEGISHLPKSTANAVEPPPPPILPMSPPNRSSSNRRKSLGNAPNIQGSKMNLRRSNTMKSTSSIASTPSPSK